jgi:uncharacterized protein YggE
MRFVSPTALATVIGLLLSVPPAAMAQEETPRTISTTGEATVYVMPDELIVRVGVVMTDAALDKAKAQNDAAARRMLAAIREAGVEAKDIQTDNLQVAIDYEDGGPSHGIEGYIVRRDYAVTLRDASKFEALIDAALNNGGNVLDGVEYRSTKLREHRDKAREMAATAAAEKARAIAGTLGMQAGTPRQISEGGVAYFGGWYNRAMYGNMSQNAFQVVGGGAAGMDETMPLGQIAIRASVSVTFDLERQQ